MRAVIIGKIWPEPTSSAAGKRTLDVIDSLVAANWEVHFACAAQKSEYSVDLEATRQVSEHAIALNCDSFDAWIAQLKPDVVIFDRFMLEEQFGWRVERTVPSALRALDTSDLHCLREARRQSMRSGQAPELRNEIALREIASIYRCDLSLIISEAEMEVLAREFGLETCQLTYWPLLLPEPAPNPSFVERRHCLMIGSFLHEPNYDAARWCREAIWPRIRESLPDAELHLYGSYPDAKAQQLHQPDDGFLFKGRARDAIETMRAYRLNLAPLRFGAGLKGKLMDAFLTGTPSVATPIAAEGMAGDMPWGSPISEVPEAFAQACVDLYRDPQAWSRAQTCGYAIAQQRFLAKKWAPELPKRLESALQNLEATRRQNFTGQLLRHHHQRSTEYLSRWIEEKNRNRQLS